MRTHTGRNRFKLGFWQLFAYSFGGMIGSGWLLGAARSAHIAGDSAWIAWLIGGAIMLIIGVVMVELGGKRHMDGGLVWWPFDSSGPAVATIVLAAIWIFYALNPASEAAATVQFASHWLPWLYDHPHDRLTGAGVGVSALLVIMLVGVNLLGFRAITNITALAGIYKIVTPLLVMALLIWSGVGGSRHAVPSHVAANWGNILTAITSGGVIYAYIGFQAPVDFGGRARDIRDIPRTVIITIIFGLIFFTSLQLLATHDGLIGTGWNGIDYDSPYARLATGIAVWGFLLEWLIQLDTIISPLGCGVVFTAALATIIENVVSQGLIVRTIWPWSGTPLHARGPTHKAAWRVLAVNLLVSLLFLPFLPGWSGLVNESSVITVFVYAIPSVSLAVRIKNPAETDGHRRLSVGVGRYLAPASFTLMTLILYWADFKVLVLGTAMTLGGAALLIAFLRPDYWRKHQDQASSELWPEWSGSRAPAAWLVGYFCGLVALGALRHYGPSGAAWLCGSAAAMILGILAFYGLVTSSHGYTQQRLGQPTTPPGTDDSAPDRPGDDPPDPEPMAA